MRLERMVDGGADVGLAQRGPLGARDAHGDGRGISGFYQHGNASLGVGFRTGVRLDSV